MAFLKVNSYVPENDTCFCVCFPGIVEWEHTGDGYSSQCCLCLLTDEMPFWSVRGCGGSFQLPLWTDRKGLDGQNYSIAKML